ncbi:glycerophosphoryl diester phosphodiesterase membrane domain-containing protein [Pseudopontixanthobacter vadosimaris]|uniref:glycerophosphoryl diester phosphodiesterase membrane domain-containing protein n=1 Tax=Pseudopontixanthobacter vadosimaris TaxID=2726450 RepID=UPI0014737360|nr:glycerophosphoryl diester phosphodiesterase membrane domain-containing protein [Pseudopontixanthobacter vadosimaris]
MTFDMSRTWTEALGLTRANFQILAIIAGVFLLLPGILFYVAAPDLAAMSAPGADAEAISAAIAEQAGPIVTFGLLSFILGQIAYMAMVALMGGDRPTVAQALKLAARRLPTLVAAFLIFIIGLVLIFTIVGLIAALFAPRESAGLNLLLAILIALISAYVVTRLSLTLPAIVLEGERNPLRALAASWRLTRPHVWKILAFYILLVIPYMVLSIVLGFIFGLPLALAGPDIATFGLGLVNGLLGALVGVVFSGILVSIYGQLAGRADERRQPAS